MNIAALRSRTEHFEDCQWGSRVVRAGGGGLARGWRSGETGGDVKLAAAAKGWEEAAAPAAAEGWSGGGGNMVSMLSGSRLTGDTHQLSVSTYTKQKIA